MLKHTIVNHITDPGIVAIIRSDSSKGVVDAAAALYEGGVRAVEISLTTPGGLDVIGDIHGQLPEACIIGAGTVLDRETVRLSVLAGAQFIVSPVYKLELIEACHRYGVPILAGAYTPTEALLAYEAGADLIKIFPANHLGPEYIRALRAPMPQLALVPTGGVTVENCSAYFAAGCAAVAIGSRVVNSQRIGTRAWEQIRADARAYVEVARQSRRVLEKS